jgi:hypothetical protein
MAKKQNAPVVATKKVGEYFELNKDEFRILAHVNLAKSEDVRVSIGRQGDRVASFQFQDSKPEVLRAIGELLIEASKLAK